MNKNKNQSTTTTTNGGTNSIIRISMNTLTILSVICSTFSFFSTTTHAFVSSQVNNYSYNRINIRKNNYNLKTKENAATSTVTATVTANSILSLIILSAQRDKNNNNKVKFNNPITSILGDMADSMLGNVMPSKYASQSSENLETKFKESVSIASWDDIRQSLKSKQTDEEKAFRSNVAKGIGPPSPLNKIRLFDESVREEDVRVTLYRDHASWCPYCQKVWMTLEEKRIPYKIEKVNMRCYGEKPSSFMKLQPNGNIPVAIIDGQLYNQSNDIIYALERLFPNHKSILPPKMNDKNNSKEEEEEERFKTQQLLRLERDLFSVWMYWLTGNFDQEGSKQRFLQVLSQVEQTLQNSNTKGDFFMGDQITIVDIMFAPFLERICASLLYFKGFIIRVPPSKNGNTATATTTHNEYPSYPAINKWFDAMETLSSYQLTKSDYYTHCWDLPPQLGGCTYSKDSEPYEKAINGERAIDGNGGSWDLPLSPHNGGIEPDWTWCGDESAALREAVERLTFNTEAITNFAARGAGRKGMPAYSAALSDPNAVPNDSVNISIDCCLRLISLAMLEGANTHQHSINLLAQTIYTNAGKEYSNDVVASLAYLRDRIGVPRDMRLPAARQLRAHLNWAIEAFISLQDQQ